MIGNHTTIEEPGLAPVFLWTKGITFEAVATKQIRNTAERPFVFRMAVMPDAHWGRGATIGSVIATKGAIIPAAVGVDIGCGMGAVRTSLTSHDIPDSTRHIRLALERLIPVAEQGHTALPARIDIQWKSTLQAGYDQLVAKYPMIRNKHGHPAFKLATLGGGNHFIELCYDEDDHVWILLHSGSRNVGNRIGMFFIDKAREDIDKQNITLVDKDLAHFDEGTTFFNDYIEAMLWAQDYAFYNRKLMLDMISDALQRLIKPFELTGEAVLCHHNYATKEVHFGEDVWVTRKGAVRAGLGDMGIIPGDMGSRSYITRGLGNELSLHSSSHGAGRAMSRGDAKKTFTLAHHIEATKGIECRKDIGVIDETVGSYKDIDQVMAAQTDLVEVVHSLKQFLNIKG